MSTLAVDAPEIGRDEKKRRMIREELDRREKLIDRLEDDQNAQDEELYRCSRNVLRFINNWCWTEDPRNLTRDLPVRVPFHLFDVQEDLIRWLDTRLRYHENGLVEKSRDMGLTWTICARMVHQWLFMDGFKGGLGSRKEDLVDNKDDPDCIFHKLRTIITNLPEWMQPQGFSLQHHSAHMKLTNPENGASITGESGENIGRGGRSTWYFLDEADHIQHLESVMSALSDNTETIIYGTTPKGNGGELYRKKTENEIKIFTLHWSDHPWKDEQWYKKKCDEETPVIVAREVEINWLASKEGICIPGEWVQACLDLHKHEVAASESLPYGDKVRRAGQDVAGSGSDRSVWAATQGPMLIKIHVWQDASLPQTARMAVRFNRAHSIQEFKYDASGMGSIGGNLDDLNEKEREQTGSPLPFEYHGIMWGAKATSLRYPDEPRYTAYERFANLKTEHWWRVRLRAKRSFEKVKGEKDHPLAECMIIPTEGVGGWETLVQELSRPAVKEMSSGKLKIESTKEMGGNSPDVASAYVLSYANPAGSTVRASGLNGTPR